MTEIMPFVGTRYNSRFIGNLSKVLSPPYDVISPEFQDKLYKRDPHNIVRLELNKVEAGDTSQNNRYTRARNTFRLWRSDSILIEDELPSLYFYEQVFKLPDSTTKSRRGFYAAVKLEDYQSGGIKAHEQTFAGPKADRLNLMRSTNANFSPIFLIYRDPKHDISDIVDSVMQETPWEEVVDDDGVIHKLWVIQDNAIIASLKALMRERSLFIADGHHRFETALNYRNEMREKTGLCDGKQPFDYMMMYLTAAEQDGMVILPTHRVLSREVLQDVCLPDVLKELRENFDFESAGVVDFDDPDSATKNILPKLVAKGKNRTPAFAMIQHDGTLTYITLKKGVMPKTLIDDESVSDIICNLDVTILHRYIFNQVMIGNPDYELETEEECFYVRDIKRVFSLLKTKRCSLAFLMNTPNMEQVLEVVQQGEKMPHKSTYFYPKTITGFVLRYMG